VAETERTGRLVRLSDTELTVADPAADVRGRAVLDRSGEAVGEVDDLFVDQRERRVRFLQVTAGGFLGVGGRHVLLPVEAMRRVDANHVHVDQRERVVGAPRYDPAVVPPPDYFAGVYDWFGSRPFWTPVAVPEDDPESADIPTGTEVVGADGEKVGEVVGVFRDYVVVQTGAVFPSDRYIPRSAIRGYDGERVRLTVTTEQALDQPWQSIPSDQPEAGGGAPRP
jgi:hypothetical protein